MPAGENNVESHLTSTNLTPQPDLNFMHYNTQSIKKKHNRKRQKPYQNALERIHLAHYTGRLPTTTNTRPLTSDYLAKKNVRKGR